MLRCKLLQWDLPPGILIKLFPTPLDHTDRSTSPPVSNDLLAMDGSGTAGSGENLARGTVLTVIKAP
jgi:hypothetical protein